MMAAGKVKRAQTAGEELANTLSHGFGAVLALGGAIPLVVRAAMSGSAKAVFSLAAYGISLVVLYTASTVYHAVKRPSLKAVLRVMDHCSIFLLILGTYVPVCLVTVEGTLGAAILAVNTACAVLGILLNAISLQRFKKFSLGLYVVMGWMGVLAVPHLFRGLSTGGFVALLLGGLSYTVGIVFYRQKEKPYRHGVWHFFVLAGTIFQFFTVYTNCCY